MICINAEYYGRYYGRNVETDAPDQQVSDVESEAAKSEFIICKYWIVQIEQLIYTTEYYGRYYGRKFAPEQVSDVELQASKSEISIAN